MENEQSSEETQGFFESIKEFIDTIKESGTSEMKINGIISMFKSIIVYLESSANISSLQSEAIRSFNEYTQANVDVFIEVDEKITTLANMVTDIASNSSKLSEEVVKLTDIAKKIPVINIDNLLKTLSEHAEEINENTATIKVIKDKLKL